jgi:hypothetical protein
MRIKADLDLARQQAMAISSRDDVDDFNSWIASPPQDRFGSLVANSNGWTREVKVEWVNPDKPEEVRMTIKA